VLAPADEPGFDRKIEGHARALQRLAQRRSSLGRVAEAKARDACLAHPAGLQIIERGPAPSRGELMLIPGGGGLERRDKGRLALGPLALLGRGDRKRQARFTRQPFDRIGEAQAFAAHDEADDIAMGAAAKAVKEPLLVTDRERGRLLVVEGTEADILP